MPRTRASARGVTAILLCLLALFLASCVAPSAVRRAERLRATGDHLGARRILIESKKTDTEALLALGNLESDLFPWHLEEGFRLLAGGDEEEALRCFKQALEIAPGHPEASRGAASALSRLHQRSAARALLEEACGEERWRAAFEAASMLRPRDLEESPRGLGEPVESEAVFPVIRARLFARFAVEIHAADEAGDLAGLEARVTEARRALAVTRMGVSVPEAELEVQVQEWEIVLEERRAAQAYSREASAGLIGGDELRSWRQYRLARLKDPGDRELALTEQSLREGFREKARLALEKTLLECDLHAAELALGWIDELAEGWPIDAPMSRADVEGWLAEGHIARAREAERRGLAGGALLAWHAARGVLSHPEFDRRVERLRSRIEAQPRLRVLHAGTSTMAAPPGLLEVIVPPLTVEEVVEQERVAESVGWVRTGVRRTVNPGHESDVRRWEKTLIETIELCDEWLEMPPTRAALGERRLQFHLAELKRIGDRLGRAGPTHERGVWRAQEVDLLQESRRIRVEQTVILARDGAPVGTMAIEVEECVSGRLPEGEIPSASLPLSGGEAAAERLRLKLEAECRRRTAFLIEDLRRAEVDRLEGFALDRAAAGDDAMALETLIAAWIQGDAGDEEADARRAAKIALWADLPPLDSSLRFSPH